MLQLLRARKPDASRVENALCLPLLSRFPLSSVRLGNSCVFHENVNTSMTYSNNSDSNYEFGCLCLQLGRDRRWACLRFHAVDFVDCYAEKCLLYSFLRADQRDVTNVDIIRNFTGNLRLRFPLQCKYCLLS